MAEVSLKRSREHEEGEGEKGYARAGEEETNKRHRSSYTQILSLLDHEEEEEPNQSDVSSIITSLQQELSSDQPSSSPSGHGPLNPKTDTESHDESGNSSATLVDATATSSSSSLVFKDDEDKEEVERERVMRHLLEASDDELGIPHGEMRVMEGGFDEVVNVGGSVEFSLYDGLWEFEDETANYYALLQSQLFM